MYRMAVFVRRLFDLPYIIMALVTTALIFDDTPAHANPLEWLANVEDISKGVAQAGSIVLALIGLFLCGAGIMKIINAVKSQGGGMQGGGVGAGIAMLCGGGVMLYVVTFAFGMGEGVIGGEAVDLGLSGSP